MAGAVDISEQILRFWFCDDPIDTAPAEERGGEQTQTGLDCARKNLWFVPAGPKRDSVDALIVERFGDLVLRAERGMLDVELAAGLLVNDTGESDSSKGSSHSSGSRQVLALVLLLDQFSRHCFRGDIERVTKCTLQATALCRAALVQGLDSHLLPAQLCFLLMPLRHFVMLPRKAQEVDVKTSGTYKIGDGSAPFGRRQALELLESRIQAGHDRLAAHSAVMDNFVSATDRRALLRQSNDPDDEEEDKSAQFSPSDILEPVCLSYDQQAVKLAAGKLVEEPAYRCILEFLRERILGSNVHGGQANDRKDVARVDLYVSLSGGVDSMVIAYCLAEIARTGSLFSSTVSTSSSKKSLNDVLRKKGKKPRKRKLSNKDKNECNDPDDTAVDGQGHNGNGLIPPLEAQDSATSLRQEWPPVSVHAIHIDYGNREESFAEARFVQSWCESLNISFIERKIDEINRGVTARDEYEKLSREFRFQAYRHAMTLHSGNDFEANSKVGIMFGHHRGDVQENVISNVMKGCSVLEISGMTSESVIEKIRVWRPLLPLDKDAVFQLAHTHGVPYFKDTTPKWSTRGKLRNLLLPSIASTYGEGFRRNLSVIAAQSDELNAMVGKVVFQPFWDRVLYGRLALIIPLDEYLDRPVVFFKIALRHICHTIGTSAPKDGATAAFTKALHKRRFLNLPTNDLNNCWVTLKHNQVSFITCVLGDTAASTDADKMLDDSKPVLILSRENCLTPLIRAGAKQQQQQQQQPQGDQTMVPGETRQFGRFKVSILFVENSSGGATILEQPTRFNLKEWLLTGRLQYVLPRNENYILCPKYGTDVPYFKKVDRRVRVGIPVFSVGSNATVNGVNGNCTSAERPPAVVVSITLIGND